jgi:hypothetical protein
VEGRGVCGKAFCAAWRDVKRKDRRRVPLFPVAQVRLLGMGGYRGTARSFSGALCILARRALLELFRRYARCTGHWLVDMLPAPWDAPPYYAEENFATCLPSASTCSSCLTCSLLLYHHLF